YTPVADSEQTVVRQKQRPVVTNPMWRERARSTALDVGPNAARDPRSKLVIETEEKKETQELNQSIVQHHPQREVFSESKTKQVSNPAPHYKTRPQAASFESKQLSDRGMVAKEQPLRAPRSNDVWLQQQRENHAAPQSSSRNNHFPAMSHKHVHAYA